jgi:hypothetical protein
MGRVFSTHGNKINAYRILGVKRVGNMPVGPRRMWEDNTKRSSGNNQSPNFL